jgi:hypothetical protein
MADCAFGKIAELPVAFTDIILNLRALQSWTLSGVQFTDGSTVSSSFTYNADLNAVTATEIVSSEATYLFQASTFAVKPFEFVFVPTCVPQLRS